MKKLYTLLAIISVCSLLAQAPQKMSYQSILRNALDGPIVNTLVGMKVSILKGSISGNAVYEEIHSVTTNINGLVSVEIGTGSVLTGTFSAINWGDDSYFIKTETDPLGGNNYTITGTSQLLSVPYAFYAENTKKQGKVTVYLSNEITDAEAIAKLAVELGPNTESIYITNTTNLTTVDLNAAVNLSNLHIGSNSSLVSVTADNLKNVDNELLITGNIVMTSVSLVNLLRAEKFSIQTNPVLTSINCPNIVKGNISMTNQPNITSVNFPVLATGSIYIYNASNLSSLNIQALTNADISLHNLTNITSVNLPVLATGSIGLSSLPNLSSLNLSAYTNGDLGLGGLSNLASVSLPVYTGGNVGISGLNLMTSLTLPNYAIGDFTVSGMQNLSSLNLPNFTSGKFSASGLSLLTSLNLPNLTSCPISSSPGFNISQTSLTSVSCPNLTTAAASFSNNASLTSINFHNFANGNFLCNNNTSLSSLDLTSFNNSYAEISTSNLQQLNLPNLVSGSLKITQNTQLTSIALPNFGTMLSGGIIHLNGNHLPSSEVNTILNKMLSVLPAGGKQIFLRQTPAAPPTGQGITDKATLISSGNTVQTD